MRILVDADACPTKAIIERVAAEYGLELIFFADESHILHSAYGKTVTVSQGRDAVDIAVANAVRKNDIVVTQDYGVASLALGKCAYAIGMTGIIYDGENIDRLMFERFLYGKIRNSKMHKAKIKHIKKRERSDDINFEINLRQLIERNL